MEIVFVGKKLKCAVPRTSPDFVIGEVVSVSESSNGKIVHIFNPKSQFGWCFISTKELPFGQWMEV